MTPAAAQTLSRLTAASSFCLPSRRNHAHRLELSHRRPAAAAERSAVRPDHDAGGAASIRDPSRGSCLAARPIPNLARSPNRRQDAPMPPPPSATYERLGQSIAERMCMSHIYQPLMLMELLGHGFARQQPARPQRRAWPDGFLAADGWAGCSPATASPPLAMPQQADRRREVERLRARAVGDAGFGLNRSCAAQSAS
jgi:hypothetical protein